MRKKRVKYKQNIKVEVIQKKSHDRNKEKSTNMTQRKIAKNRLVMITL